MNVTRRTALGLGAALAAAVTLPGCDGPVGILGPAVNEEQGSAGTLRRSAIALPRPFTVPLAIPAIPAPTRSTAEADYYEITQRQASVEVLPGTRTTIWGYNGTLPGPTLVSRRGRQTVVTHHNELPVPVVVHLHGGRTPPEHDGYPADLILPAGDHQGHASHDALPGHGPAAGQVLGSREYHYPMEQPAGTLWYHDHRMDFTGPQVYRGLAGFHLITDDAEQALGLPSGERDIPLMVMDRSFDANAQFDYPSLDPALVNPGVAREFTSGVLGDCILVNGRPWPVLDVDTARYRFRLLNASNARRYALGLDPDPSGTGMPFVQIGADAGLLPAPAPASEIELAQGERVDVVIDFAGRRVGDTVVLHNRLGSAGTDVVMAFRVVRQVTDTARVPERLADVESVRESDAVVRRQFWFARNSGDGTTGMWAVNGEAFSATAIAARPALGSVERWTIHALNVPHPFHLHLARFQVIERDGDPGAPAPVRAWKDTVSLDNGGSAELLVRFDGYRGTYVFHCHNLEHEDMGMMANVEVI